MSDTTDRILNTVQARVNGITEDFLNTEFASACEDFFERSSAWLQEIRTTVRADRTSVILPLPHNDCRIVQLLHTGTNSQRLTPVPFTVTGETSQSLFVLEPPYTLRLRNARTEDLAISVIAVLTAADIDAFPEELLIRHRAGVEHMLMGRLFEIPQRPWSSPALAAWHYRQARRAVSEAHRLAFRGLGGPAWTFPAFA